MAENITPTRDSSRHPDQDTLHAALTLAIRAPSVHNTQPWQWRLGDTTVHLYADDTRSLGSTDPDRRDLLVSCGVALHHLQVAMRVFGWEPVVHRLPNPAEPNHLASIEFHSATATQEQVRLARAIVERHTDRRRFTSWEVHAGQIAKVIAAGAVPGVLISVVDSPQDHARLRQAFEQAAAAHAQDGEYRTELAFWSGRHATSVGVPAKSAVPATDATTRHFSAPELAEAVVRDTEATPPMLLVCTASDDTEARLRAGEAASAVLLTATARGLATCPLSEPLELPEVRERLRTELLGGFGYPQLIIRIGWAATSADPLPATPRLPLQEVVRPL